MQPSVEPFEFEVDLANITHGRCLLKVCLINSTIGLALVILTVFSRRFHYPGARAVSWIIGVLTAGFYFLLTSAILKFGMLWPAADGSEVLYGGTRYLVVWTRAADYAYLVAWYAVSSLLALGANRWLQFRVRR
jgi:hypothetical protein